MLNGLFRLSVLPCVATILMENLYYRAVHKVGLQNGQESS